MELYLNCAIFIHYVFSYHSATTKQVNIMKVCAFILLIMAYGNLTSNVCMCQTGAKQSIIDDFYDQMKQIPDDPCWKCLLHCNGVSLGAFSVTGEIDVQKWADVFDYIDIPLAQKCAAIADPDPCQRAYLVVKCVDDHLTAEYPL
ncbi:hypothetical protein ILUMI_03910 [Ignelater luminosus]|uniref:Uncharacterized protein n=1 Tax=Ignelater luminosus TaxID=2038154 RepID=A0A8K0DFP7_IGNLU|nr:hypothetical protein ILUMI_03910 [Ignelater luminosus]